MPESKSKEPEEGKLQSLLKRVPGGALIFAVIPLAAISYFAWFHYGAEHLDQALYSLDANKLRITEQPDWIRQDLAKSVYESHQLNRVSLLDPQSSSAIAQAFDSSPWIKSTTRVTKEQGGTVQVDLVYRRPVAMVFVEYEDNQSGAPKKATGFYLIDEETIVLPGWNYTEEDYKNYLVIASNPPLDVSTVGDGKEFGSPAVSVAANLCSLLVEHRERYKLATVRVDKDFSTPGTSPWLLTVFTSDGRRIIWGRPPGNELHGEPEVSEKLTRIRQWLEQDASMSTAQNELDLRGFASSTVSSTR
ncbi:MAG TPA: hypothetical protein DDW52_18505 [Planctomycetaceae bacterium]|nr:hypothetical protein [Planctomycetaceae bacterium]